MMPGKGWKRPFDDPIPLPDGRQLVTIEDAGNYITKLGVMKATNRGHVRTFDPDRKDPHWGKRKLRRDQ